MHQLPSDRSICSSSSSSPAASPDSASLSVYLRRRSVCAHSSDDTRTRHTWKAVAQVMLEFPMGDLECQPPDPGDIIALNSTRYFDINDFIEK